QRECQPETGSFTSGKFNFSLAVSWAGREHQADHRVGRDGQADCPTAEQSSPHPAAGAAPLPHAGAAPSSDDSLAAGAKFAGPSAASSRGPPWQVGKMPDAHTSRNMAPDSILQLLDALLRLRTLSSSGLQDLLRQLPDGDSDPEATAKELLT